MVSIAIVYGGPSTRQARLRVAPLLLARLQRELRLRQLPPQLFRLLQRIRLRTSLCASASAFASTLGLGGVASGAGRSRFDLCNLQP